MCTYIFGRFKLRGKLRMHRFHYDVEYKLWQVHSYVHLIQYASRIIQSIAFLSNIVRLQSLQVSERTSTGFTKQPDVFFII